MLRKIDELSSIGAYNPFVRPGRISKSCMVIFL